MTCCGTFQRTDDISCCGRLQPTSSSTPVPPVEPVAIINVTSVVQLGVVDKPAGVVDGTWLVACTGSDAAITPPAGFVQVGLTAFFDIAFAGFNWETALYAKFIPDASLEPATYDFSVGASWIDVWLVALENVGSLGDTAERPPNPTSTTGTTATGASVTAIGTGAMLLRFDSANAVNRDTGPVGMTALPGSPIDGAFNGDYESVGPGPTGDKNSTYAIVQTWATQMLILEAA